MARLMLGGKAKLDVSIMYSTSVTLVLWTMCRSCILNIVPYASEHCTDDVLPKSTKKCAAVTPSGSLLEVV
jgi:hypothetical protein